jgi:hypothetical protein
MVYVMLLPGLSLLGATLWCLEVTGGHVKSRRAIEMQRNAAHDHGLDNDSSQV